MTDLKIERLGGLAGFGLPNSRLKSFGRCKLSDLTDTDQKTVDALFADKNISGQPAQTDVFRYRITRETAKGTETVEVPETLVPSSLVACVKDEIV